MSDPPLLRLAPSVALKEKRLAELLAGREPTHRELREAVEEAQVVGSLELAGLTATAQELHRARQGDAAPAPVIGMLRALRAVDPQATFSVKALCAWQAAVTSGPGELRRTERERTSGPPPAPAAFVQSRLALLEQWLAADSSRELKPVQQAALAMARIVEILPFEEGNGRVSRLAAAHLMTRAGMRPPLLEGADVARLQEALQAAFQLYTEGLCALLEEAAGRSLDLMIRVLESGRS